MTTYASAPSDVSRMIQALVHDFHPDLEEAGVTFVCLFAHASRNEANEPDGPALKLHGYACAATVRIVNLKDRAKGIADVEILLDGDRWETWTEERQRAVIDHELQHIEVQFNSGEGPKLDDMNRPKLRLRNHDHQFGWFDAIAQRHGSASIEIFQAVNLVCSPAGQLYFPFVGQMVTGLSLERAAVDAARHGSAPVTEVEMWRERMRAARQKSGQRTDLFDFPRPSDRMPEPEVPAAPRSKRPAVDDFPVQLRELLGVEVRGDGLAWDVKTGDLLGDPETLRSQVSAALEGRRVVLELEAAGIEVECGVAFDRVTGEVLGDPARALEERERSRARVISLAEESARRARGKEEEVAAAGDSAREDSDDDGYDEVEDRDSDDSDDDSWVEYDDESEEES